MSNPLFKLTSAALAMTALIVGSNAHAQTVQQQLDALKVNVALLNASALRQANQIKTLQDQVGNLQTSNTALQTQLANAHNVLALDPFVSVDPNPQIGVAGPHITFRGANIHIVSGSQATDNNGNHVGLGNLIIGYDEDPASVLGGSPLQPGDRSGSHNLVIGRYHRFLQSAFGGLVAGENNTISIEGASVSGGSGNTASGVNSIVSGGNNNRAVGAFASVSGGDRNSAVGSDASVSGGAQNNANGPETSVTGGNGGIASGNFASISGGFLNTASGVDASVTGGEQNIASARGASVTGGFLNVASGVDANVTAGIQNTASGTGAIVVGGSQNGAGGQFSTILGFANVVNSNQLSIAPGAPLNPP